MSSVLDHSPSTRTARPRRRAAAGATLALLTATGLVLDQSGTAQAATAIGLGTATSFAVLAGSGITNTGPTVITGNIGTGPTVTTVIGESSITLTGTHEGDQVKVGAAKADLQTAYDNAAAQATTQTIADLTGKTLSPGVYASGSSMLLTGALTLDAQGDSDAVFVFTTVSTLDTTGTTSRVSLINGAQACNVFWKVGSSVTLDASTVFVGNILAHDSISLNTGASVTGRVLAMGGAVTLMSNTITRPGCTTGGSGGSGSGGSGSGGASSGGSGGSGSSSGGAGSGVSQVAQVPVGSVDAGDGSSLLGRSADSRE